MHFFIDKNGKIFIEVREGVYVPEEDLEEEE